MKTLFSVAALAAFSASVVASPITVEMYAATPDGPGAHAGAIVISGTEKDGGTHFSLNLTGMKPLSVHGFHVHANGDCGPKEKNTKMVPALAAGGHWDPENTGKHEGVDGNGHLGDLPRVAADSKGQAILGVIAPRIKDKAALKGHALMVHAGGDNYSDTPKKLGGGGARMFCGVIN